MYVNYDDDDDDEDDDNDDTMIMQIGRNVSHMRYKSSLLFEDGLVHGKLI